MNHIIRKITLLAALLTAVLLYSCSSVDFRNEGDGSQIQINPTETRILFNLDWSDSELESGQIPSSMIVAMSRIKNTVHYVYSIDNEGKFIEDTLSAPVNGKAPEAGQNPDTDQNPGTDQNPDTGQGQQDGTIDVSVNSRLVGNGDYYAMAIAHGTKEFKYEISDLQEFATNLDIPMTSLEVTIPNLTKSEIMNAELLEFNPTCPYIHSADSLYYEVRKFSLPPVKALDDGELLTTETGEVKIVLKPEKITRDLTFRIRMDYEPGVTIDSVIAVVSGVPRSIQMMTGIISASAKRNSGKVNFGMKEIDGNSHIFEGTVGVLGLFPSENSSFITGPGILQIFVRASVMDENVRRERMLHAGINISDVIKAADLMVQVDKYEKNGYRSTRDALLEISSPLKIKRSHVISDMGQGLVEWKENGDVNVEL